MPLVATAVAIKPRLPILGGPGRLPVVVPDKAASLTTALAGTNNDFTLTAVTPGTAGNSIRVRLVDPAAASAAQSVSVAGNDITVNLATSAGSAITSTAGGVVSGIAASGPAAALVNSQCALNESGAGVVTALGYTNLTGGAATYS